MNLKPWREIAVPHKDVRENMFQQSEFAADLSRVHDGTATAEYQSPTLFFERTFITEGMRLLLESVVKRLSGKGGDPVIQLQTAFGGGKTHTMLAVYHLAKGEASPRDMPGIGSILDAAGITELPRARIAVLDGIKSSPNQPVIRDGQAINTLWGDLAWQLGKAEGYAIVAAADASGTSPGKAVLETLLSRYAPCVILIDELVAYVRQFEDGKTLTGGSFDSNLTFVQALTEALKAVPTGMLLASLPESKREAGSDHGAKALDSLERYFGRVQALWKPVGTEEAFEIVRRRLFETPADPLAAETVCRAFADYYLDHANDFPRETQESRYFERLMRAYPIHPEVFDRLYEDWSSLDNFQRTRGVLKLMAKVIHCLWKENDKDLLIMPGSFPLKDSATRNELLYHLAPGWDPVITRNVDGDKAETTEIENVNTLLGSVQACRRSARAIFLGSAPSTSNQMVRGIELERVMLGVVQPGQQVVKFKDGLSSMGDRLHYLNSANNRFWFDTRPNLRREMEDRKRRFSDNIDVFKAIEDGMRSVARAGGVFGRVHVFTRSSDVPDDFVLKLIVLPPDASYSRSATHRQAFERAQTILENRGDLPRHKQNRLIFLAPDYDSVSRLRDQTRSVLAWQSIVSDIENTKLILDQIQAKHASKSLSAAKDALSRMLRETYKWVLAPLQGVSGGRVKPDIEWDVCEINPGAPNLAQDIERVLKDTEALITQWSPIHLHAELARWFWKEDAPDAKALTVWQQSCRYLYLPRLADDGVFQRAIAMGTDNQDFFGLAQGREENRYLGFTFGTRAAPILDDALLLIEPKAAAAFREATRVVEPDPDLGPHTKPELHSAPNPSPNSKPGPKPAPSPRPKTRFFASVDLNPYTITKHIGDVSDEVLKLLTDQSGVDVTVTIEIQAKSASGFDGEFQRTLRENCHTLKFRQSQFESDA
ncbi:ATP-binding protein [Caballeronia sp. S22]|uniref:ATP-binding protein n=1 Tax=Caballeronia sp. S22 TaxID=3137182 RepID=UPI003530A0F1